MADPEDNLGGADKDAADRIPETRIAPVSMNDHSFCVESKIEFADEILF
jgi:hypothetical protein